MNLPRRLIRAATASLVAATWALSAAGSANAYVYWTNFGQSPNGDGTSLGRATLDGTVTNRSFVSGASGPADIAVDATHVYWVNYGSGGTSGTFIARANLDGTGVDESFVSIGQYPNGLAVDGAHIYWLSGSYVGRVRLDGTVVEPNWIPAVGAIGLAVGGPYLYWATGDSSGAIVRRRADGAGLAVRLVNYLPRPTGVAVDGSHLYWVENDASVGRAGLDGSNPDSSFIPSPAKPLRVAVDGGHVYWTNYNDGTGTTIGRADLDGNAVDQSFITGASGPVGVAVDSLAPPPAAQPPAPLPPAGGSGSPGSDPPPAGDRFAGIGLGAASVLRVTAGSVRVGVKCPTDAPAGCTGVLTLTTVSPVSVAGRSGTHKRTIVKLGQASFVVPAGRHRSVRVRLTRAARTLLNKHRRLKARVTAVSHDGVGTTRTTTRRITLAAPAQRH